MLILHNSLAISLEIPTKKTLNWRRRLNSIVSGTATLEERREKREERIGERRESSLTNTSDAMVTQPRT